MSIQEDIPTQVMTTDRRGSLPQPADKFVSGETQKGVEEALEWVSRLVDSILKSKSLPQDFLTPQEKRNMANFTPAGYSYLLISVRGMMENIEMSISEKINSTILS